MKYLISLLVGLTFLSCQNTETQSTSPKKTYPAFFKEVLDAHGGLDKWNEMNTLVFTKGENEKAEIHTTDLKSRKARIEVKDKYALGFDGNQVWVSPHRDSFPGKSPTFYHNLYFYFVAIPFVLADPGVNLEDLGKQDVNGKMYRVIKSTFDDGVGEASGDHYIMYTDPTTHRVEFITYSVTYYDQTKATKYNALKFDWEDVNGLLFPNTMTGYKWENDALGDVRYERIFRDVQFLKEKSKDEIYAVPTGAFTE